MTDATRELAIQSNARRCSYCHVQVEAEAGKVVCQDCLAVVHEDCWNEGGACPTCAGGRRLAALACGEPLFSTLELLFGSTFFFAKSRSAWRGPPPLLRAAEAHPEPASCSCCH